MVQDSGAQCYRQIIVLMARFMTGKGLVFHGRPLIETDGNPHGKELLQEHPCLKGTAIGSSTVLRRLSKEFGQVSQVGTKTTLTPVMNKKKLDFARRHRHWTR